MLEQAFKDAKSPPDGSPSQLPSFVKELKLVNFKLGNAPPRVNKIRVPEVSSNHKDDDNATEHDLKKVIDDIIIPKIEFISVRG